MNVDLPSWAGFTEGRGGSSMDSDPFDWILSSLYDDIPLVYEVYAV